MAHLEMLSDAQQLALMAVTQTVQCLNAAIARQGIATWALAGGTAPMGAYRLLAQERYIYAVDWARVHILIGDERCVPLDDPDSSWLHIDQILLSKLPIPAANLLRPPSDLPAEAAAKTYEKTLAALPQTKQGIPRLDCMWLGVGEDGHTLSLFPGNPALDDVQDRLVVPVHHSPKPPSDRITLTLHALQGTVTCLILASDTAKAAIATRAQAGDASLPITKAVAAIEQDAGGTVTWLISS